MVSKSTLDGTAEEGANMPLGNIEVYAPNTSNIFHFFDVTNY